MTGTPERDHAADHLAGLAPASLVVAAGRPPRIPGAPVNTPVELSATYAAPLTGTGYGRNGNATWTALEEAVGVLEHGDALVFASGMAAVAAAMAFVPAGGTVVAPRNAYNITTALLADYAAEGHTVRHVVPSCRANPRKATSPPTHRLIPTRWKTMVSMATSWSLVPAA